MSSLLLAIETSCDETAVAVLRGRELLASVVASQVAAHQPYGGVVPEVASRHHLQRAPQLLADAVASAGISLEEIDAFAATSGPGLASSLMIGASLAKGLALGFGKPYLAINHLEGHLLSPFFGCEDGIEPNISLIVSGGHTLLVEVDEIADYRTIGRTVDDAAGEAFDKVAKMLGLSYPGGPEIERCARHGDPTRFDLPRSMINSGDANFSFSGLKTAVRYLLPKLQRRPIGLVPNSVEALQDKTEDDISSEGSSHGATGLSDWARDERDLCASFQRAVIDVLVAKTLGAAQMTGRNLITVSGGVSCNGELRRLMSSGAEGEGLEVRFAAPTLCTDNATMIAFVAQLRLERGESTPFTAEIDPNLALPH